SILTILFLTPVLTPVKLLLRLKRVAGNAVNVPAVITATPVWSRCHDRHPFYCRAGPKQTRKAVPRVPALPPRHQAVGEENARQAALLRPVGRPRRRARQVPRGEGHAARRAGSEGRPGGNHRAGLVQLVLEPETTTRGRRRTLAPNLERLQGRL